MATTIPCTVDTHPMADKIRSVSRHIDATTGAVVAMESAVILAEKKGADRVCNNVNRGFFTMIQSQISQKIASHYSRVEALLMKLSQQRRRLVGVKHSMEKEYRRICERYFKIFTSINKELERRIKELDRPVFDLVNRDMQTSTNRMLALAGLAGVTQQENLTKSETMVLSNLKIDALHALNGTEAFLSHLAEQKRLTDQIMINNPYDNSSHTCDVPVGICESIVDRGGIPMTTVTVCEGLAKTPAHMVEDVVSRSEDLPWKDAESNKAIDEEFIRLLNDSTMPNRVKEMARKIYEQNKYQTL